MMSQSTATSKDSAGKISTGRRNYWLTALEQRASYLPHAPFLLDVASARDGLLAWEEEIAILRDLVTSAQTRRNAFVPVGLLPPEILSRIFIYVKIYSTESTNRSWISSQDGRIATFDWLAITQVCKSWRSVAVGHSALWAEISNEPNQMQPWDTFLQRARSYPLSIAIAVPRVFESYVLSAADTTDLRLINEHLHHTRDLRLRLRNPIPEALTSLISNTAPKPGLLELHLYRMSYPTPIVLPLSFFKSASALREITLEGFQFPWDAVLPNLQALTVRYDARDFDDFPNSSPSDFLHCDTDSILRCLRHMPRLEELSLSLLSIPVNVSSSVEDVALPYLKKISLSGAPQACFDIWRPIRAHPHANIFILAQGAPDIMQDPQVGEAQVQGAISTLSLHLTSPGSPAFTRFSIFGNGSSVNKLFMETDLPPNIDDAKDGDRKQTWIELRFNLTQSSRNALVALCSKIPLHHTAVLDVHEMNSLSTEDWALLLSAARSLEVIMLSDISQRSVRAFCSVMTPAGIPSENRASYSQQTAPEHHALVPHLVQLELDCIDLGTTSSNSNTRTVASCLGQMFKARKSVQCALQVVTINDCYNTRESEIEQFKQFVAEVEWDGGSDSEDLDGLPDSDLSDYY